MAMDGWIWDSWFGVGLCMWSPMTAVAISMKWLVAPMSLWVLANAMDDAMAISGKLWGTTTMVFCMRGRHYVERGCGNI